MSIAKSELAPPWKTFPGQPPWWSGWRQGESEAWLQRDWLPFWRTLNTTERCDYLTRWVPPDDDWREYVSEHWS